MSENPEYLTARIWRGQAEGAYVDYSVPGLKDQTVLDVVTWVQRHLEPSLSYRFSCRVGMCGSCAMTVNGRPRWTCRTHIHRVLIDGHVKIGPLRNLPTIKDLTADMAPFFSKWRAAGGTFVPSANRSDAIPAIRPEEPERALANSAIECINCGVCYAACDTVAWNADYLGPAGLNRAWTLVNDRRDRGQTDRLTAVRGKGGCHLCHSHASCTEYCPKGLNPALSVAGLKRRSTRLHVTGRL